MCTAVSPRAVGKLTPLGMAGSKNDEAESHGSDLNVVDHDSMSILEGLCIPAALEVSQVCL